MKHRSSSIAKKWFAVVIIASVLLQGCESSQNKSESTNSEHPETVDVYQNPNDFIAKIPALQVGQKPPSLEIEKWIKGELPTGGFEIGKVYVVEFWASWCRPCRKSIPHLNYLQNKYHNEGLRIIAVAASEYNGSGALERLVEKKGKDMEYSVAYTSDSTVFQNWNWAAKNTGLPWTFVIDREGKLAWWGQPFFSDFNVVLRAVLTGTYSNDLLPNDLSEQRQELWNLQTEFWENYVDNEYAKAIEIGTQLFDSGDELFYYEAATVYELLFEIDESKARDLLDKLLSSYLINIPEGIEVLVSTILNSDRPYATRHYPKALELSLLAKKLTFGENPATLKTLGIAHWKNGHLDSARYHLSKAKEISDLEEFRNSITQMEQKLQ